MEKKLFDKDTFMSFYNTLSQDKGLMEVLSQMQVQNGINERKAYENAEVMIRMLSYRETTKGMLSDDTKAAVEDFLHNSATMSGYDRKLMLHEFYFGLKLYQDGALADRMKEGTHTSTLFREYYASCGEDPAVTEEKLEAQILALLDGYSISPTAMNRIARRLEKEGDLLATSAALGEEGQRFKCIAAMDLYLRNQMDMTMEEALNLTCTDIDIQAVADAVAAGQITRDNAKKMLNIIVLALLLTGFALVLLEPMITSFTAKVAGFTVWDSFGVAFAESTKVSAAVAKNTAALMPQWDYFLLAGAVLNFITDPVADLLGRVAAKHRFLRSCKESRAADAMLDMAKAEEEAVQCPYSEVQGNSQKQQVKNPQILSAFNG